MAGGKLTPRQKMINMMYLVLTALLALNVSREVMDAFFDVMQNQQNTINTVNKQNNSVYAAFDAANLENPTKAGPWRTKAYDVKDKAEELGNYLAELKETLVTLTGGWDEETGKPKSMDNKEKVANYLIIEKHGEELKSKMNAYRDALLAYSSENEQLSASLKQVFNTDDVTNKEGVPEPWEKHKFEHYPLISVMTFLTGMQSDVTNAEAQVIDHLQENIGKADLKFTGVKAMVLPKSTYITQGDFYEADVFLAAYDETQEPEITINGQSLSADQISGGIGKYKIKTSATGEIKWAGVINIKQGGELKPYEVSGVYTVAPPSVVISPSKLNVLYRMVDNPLEISVPGVDPSKIKVSGSGITKVSGGYMANVTGVSGKEMTITVQVLDDEGKVKQTQSKLFRIKGLPQAEASIYKRSGGGEFSKSLVKNATIEAGYPDFPYDLTLTVTSFEVKIEGYPPAKISGNTLDGTNKSRIDGLRPGSSVTIRKIVARTPKGDQVTNIGNLSIDVN
jgi:gliding motility-associated protein GldM